MNDNYKNFLEEALSIKEAYESGDLLGSQPHIEEMFSDPDNLVILTEEEFNQKNNQFKDRWKN